MNTLINEKHFFEIELEESINKSAADNDTSLAVYKNADITQIHNVALNKPPKPNLRTTTELCGYDCMIYV